MRPVASHFVTPRVTKVVESHRYLVTLGERRGHAAQELQAAYEPGYRPHVKSAVRETGRGLRLDRSGPSAARDRQGSQELVRVTTDSIVTNARFDELDLNGPLCRMYRDARRRVTGSDNMLESRARAAQLLPWKTRGIATLKAIGEPKLARAGMKEPREVKGAEAANAWFVEQFFNRQPGDTWLCRHPNAFPEMHEKGLDMIFEETARKFSFEYDLKREPADADMRQGHLAFSTRPWRTVEKCLAARKESDEWQRRRQGQFKTIADLEDWQEFRYGTVLVQHGINRTAAGYIDQVRRTWLRAYVQRQWGLPGNEYEATAQLLSELGYPTTGNDLKKAKLRSNGPLPERLIKSQGPGVADFITAVSGKWPTFEWYCMVDEPEWDRLATLSRPTEGRTGGRLGRVLIN